MGAILLQKYLWEIWVKFWNLGIGGIDASTGPSSLHMWIFPMDCLMATEDVFSMEKHTTSRVVTCKAWSVMVQLMTFEMVFTTKLQRAKPTAESRLTREVHEDESCM
jgi:hypothetical protein